MITEAIAIVPVLQFVVVAALAAGGMADAYLIPVLLLSALSNVVIKALMGRVLPSSVVDRPSGRGTLTGPPVSCGMVPIVGTVSSTAGGGLPSGHAQFAATLAAFVTRAYLMDARGANRSMVAAATALWAVALAVSWQRVHVGCHTTPQVVYGIAIGGSIGWSGHALTR